MTGIVLYSLLMFLAGMMFERLLGHLYIFMKDRWEAKRYSANRGRW